MVLQLFASRSRRRKWLGLLLGLLTLLGLAAAAPATATSSYRQARQAEFNRVEAYPIKPLPTTTNYRPTGEWVGRLILPAAAEYVQTPGDWAWLEVWHAPMANPDLLGQKIRLTWQPGDAAARLIEAVTQDVQLSERALRQAERGMVVPTRLNGRTAVGPLQSLAGARPEDDMTVRLEAAKLVFEGDRPVLQTALEPVQVSGREYALAKLLGPDPAVQQPLPVACPGPQPCPSEFFRVQHYRSSSNAFDGDIETVRIPQQPAVNNRFFSNLHDLTDSPAGAAGWYFYGSRDRDGIFTVQALRPRALFQLTPDQVVLGEKAGLNYIDRQNWRQTPARKATLQRVLVSPDAASPEAALAQWQVGDYALVVHLFGGIGGENKELSPVGTVTGHFAYGLGRVIRDPFTQELQLDVLYEQIYAHNPSGITAGTHDWSAYMGDMQRGWLGQRPVSDVVVKLDAFIQPLTLGPTTLSLFRELLIQSQVISARYRTGDGTGLAAVTPATSCVQDANQALFIAIEQIKRQAAADPTTAAWVQQHPDDPAVQQLDQFIRLGRALTQTLVPYGVVRTDWVNNAEALAGVNGRDSFASNSGLVSGILSWRSMMPRWAHDDISQIFLQNGGQLWFLRTNQVGGYDPTIMPVAPTLLLGGIPLVGRAVKRLADAVALLSWTDGGLIGAALLLYGAIALPYGFKSSFLRPHWAIASPWQQLWILLKLLIFPALGEELFFRVLLLPHPVEGVPLGRWLLWALLSLSLFIAYHLLSAHTYYKIAAPTFQDRRFLLLMGWLGIVLTGLYWLSGSLWAVVLVHWIVVVMWLLALGGWPRLHGQLPAPQRLPKPTA